MLKRLAPALALLLVTAACGGTDYDVQPVEPKGAVWFPQVVEFENNAGPGLAIDTDPDGNPHMSYLELPEALPEGATPPPVDPLDPILPAVGHAHLVTDIWTHSEVVKSESDEKLLPLTEEDETAIVVDDEGGHHIAWTEDGQVMYSNDTTGEAEPQVVAEGSPTGLAIAASDIHPGVAFWDEQSDPEGPTALLRFATFNGDDWDVETVAEGEPFLGPDASVDLAVNADGEPIVAYDSGEEVQIATRDGARWTTESVDEGVGVSLDTDADGNPHIAYVTPDGQVRHAHSIDGGDWEISDVGGATALATTSIALDPNGVHHIAWQRDQDIAYANNADGEFAEVPLPSSTIGGQRARLAAGPSAVYLAWYSPTGTRLSMATYTEDQPLLAVPSPPPAPGGATAACEPEGDTLTIAAQGLAFDKDCLAVEAGQPYTIEFDNKDAGQSHNVNVYTDDSASEAILMEPLEGVILGPAQTTYEGDPIEEPGDLHFQCDVHPTMAGTFVVAGK